MNEEEVLAFIHTDLGSVCAVELLLLLKRDTGKDWQRQKLISALRSSSMAVTQAISRLQAAGMISEKSPGTYRFEPRSPRHQEMAAAIERISAEKPMTLIKAIAEIPNEKLRNFSDAFKFRD